MNCRELCARLHEWADGELPPEEQELVEQHLEKCLACCRHADAARNLKLLVQHRASREEMPRALKERVLQLLEDESRRVESSAWRRLSASPLLRAAAVVLVLVLGVFSAATFFDREPHLAHATVMETNRTHHARYKCGDDQPRWACSSMDEVLATIRREVNQKAELPPWLGPVKPCGVSPYEYEGLECLQVFCTLDGEKVSLFVFPSVPDRVPQKTTCWCAGKKDDEEFLVICWAEDTTYYSMVTERSGKNIQRFVRSK